MKQKAINTGSYDEIRKIAVCHELTKRLVVDCLTEYIKIIL